MLQLDNIRALLLFLVFFFSESIEQLILSISSSSNLTDLKSNAPLEYIWFPVTWPKYSNCHYLQWKGKLFKLKNLVFWLKYSILYRKTKFLILKAKIFDRNTKFCNLNISFSKICYKWCPQFPWFWLFANTLESLADWARAPFRNPSISSVKCI